MTERVLVCVIGQTRAHALTWTNFKKNVLDELNADLALCVSDDPESNPFWTHARYAWISPDYADWGDGFDEAQRHLGGTGEWRGVTRVPDFWLGGIKGCAGSAGIMIYHRWMLLHNLVRDGMLEHYDRFIITRSDYFWPIPHPPMALLTPDKLWFPNGEFYGGLTDRHCVLAAADVPKALNLIDAIVLEPERLVEEMLARQSYWNLESYILYHFEKHDLLSRTMMFPYVMYTVRGAADGTRGAPGIWNDDVGMIVKYEFEYVWATVYAARIRSSQDWLAMRDELQPAPQDGRFFLIPPGYDLVFDPDG